MIIYITRKGSYVLACRNSYRWHMKITEIWLWMISLLIMHLKYYLLNNQVYMADISNLFSIICTVGYKLKLFMKLYHVITLFCSKYRRHIMYSVKGYNICTNFWLFWWITHPFSFIFKIQRLADQKIEGILLHWI